MTIKTISSRLTDIEQFGGKCPNDDRCMDLAEALDRFIREAIRDQIIINTVER